MEEVEVVEHFKDLLFPGGLGVPIESDFVWIEAKWGIPDDEICTRYRSIQITIAVKRYIHIKKGRRQESRKKH